MNMTIDDIRSAEMNGLICGQALVRPSGEFLLLALDFDAHCRTMLISLCTEQLLAITTIMYGQVSEAHRVDLDQYWCFVPGN